MHIGIFIHLFRIGEGEYGEEKRDTINPAAGDGQYQVNDTPSHQIAGAGAACCGGNGDVGGSIDGAARCGCGVQTGQVSNRQPLLHALLAVHAIRGNSALLYAGANLVNRVRPHGLLGTGLCDVIVTHDAGILHKIIDKSS